MVGASRDRKFLPKKKTYSSGKTDGLNEKDALFNKLVDDFESRGLGFAFSMADSEGSYMAQVLCNTLWYLTNQHAMIHDAALRRPNIKPVPPAFHDYQGFNNIRRKKTKQQGMDARSLDSHTQALYSICAWPLMSSSAPFKTLRDDVLALAECMVCYKTHLETQLQETSKRHKLDHPARQIHEHVTVESRTKTQQVKAQYQLLDQKVKSADIQTPVFFDEDDDLHAPFNHNMQRFRFMQNLQLSVPVDMFRYAPGGGSTTVLVVVQVADDRTDSDAQTQSARMMSRIMPDLPQKHTRQMKKQFKDRLDNIAHRAPSVVEFIYKELAMDSSASDNNMMQQRLKMIALGETGLIADLRALNGRPGGAYDFFFVQLAEVVEEVTAADERRHNTAHFSEWLSLKDLILKTTDRCPPETPVPSSSLVRLQFVPRNHYAATALRFTSKIDVQYKIQRRQLRAYHIDAHYCAALFKYIRELAILLAPSCLLCFADDKAKVPIGEPGAAIASGVRGRKTLAPSSTTIASMDHDVHHVGSLTPSVYLGCAIPATVGESFYRGTVTTIVNDSVFQASSPFRHAATLVKMLKEKDEKAHVLLKFSDGGTDQRNTLESVVCSLICVFKELDLDMLIAGRCAPGQSYTNPAERVMAILNIGLHNVAIEHRPGSQETEKLIKSKAHSMKELRKLAEDHPDLSQEWTESIEPVQSLLRNRFTRLTPKDKPFQVLDPIPAEEIDILKEPLRILFPNLDLTKLQKQYTKKCVEYQQWVDVHCHRSQYCLQMRKCEDTACCSPSSLPRDQLHWLPLPVLDNTGEHYRPFQECYKSGDPSDGDMPSVLQEKKDRRAPKPRQTPAVPIVASEEPASSPADAAKFTGQDARVLVECVDCRKPCVVHSTTRLSERQKLGLAIVFSEYEYSCGSEVVPPEHSLHNKVFVRTTLIFESRVESSYYSSDIGRKDTCCFCACPEAEVDGDLKRTVQNCSACVRGLQSHWSRGALHETLWQEIDGKDT